MSSARTDSARIAVRKVLRDARDKNKWRKVVRFRLWMPVVLQLILIGLVMWYAESKFPGFINERNVTSVLFLAVPLAIVAMGQTHALLVGALDLSVGAMVTFGVVIASFLIGTDSTNVQILMGSAVILLAGVGLGLANSGLILGFKIPSIIATLATLSILNGISLTLRETSGGRIDRRFTGWLSAEWGPIPIAFIGVVLGALAFDYWLHASGSGLQLRSAGFDERSAKRNGVRTTWVRARAILLAALLAAVASFFVMARSSIGNAQIGDSYALASITAAVLGGAALSGGRATFLGATVASVLLALIVTALPFLDLSAEHGLMITGILVLLGIVLFQLGDLKELVKRNYKRARRVAVGSKPPKTTEIPELYPDGVDFAVAPTGRTLIKGGHVLSMDPAIGDLPRGDVLIDGDRIVEVGRDLAATDAEVIDATGMIVMPGFVDTHRHIWEGLLRNIGTDVPLEGRSSYISHVLHKLAPAFRPEDAYIGDLVSALGAIDAGITTLLDWSHIQGSPAHTDAVVQALNDSGLRAVFAYGFPWWGKWEERQPSWFVRAATEHFSTKDQMVTLALAAPGPEFTDFEVSRDHWKLAREADARITTHVGVGSYGLDGKVQEIGRGGSARARHHLHPLHHAERHRDPDDRGHRRHGLPRLTGGDDDGPRHAADPEVPRSWPQPQPQRRRRDERAERHVQPDAVGARAAGRPGLGRGEAAVRVPRRARLRHDRGRGGERPRGQGGLAHARQAGRPHPAAHRSHERDAAQRSGHGRGGGHGHQQRRHGADRRSRDEAPRRAAVRRLARREGDGRRCPGSRPGEVGVQAPSL